MASVDQTVRESLESYPTLFHDRREVLEFLFTVLGNGYEWENGEIVRKYGKDDSFVPWSADTDRAQYKDHLKKNYDDDMWVHFIENYTRWNEDRITAAQHVIDNLDECAQTWSEKNIDPEPHPSSPNIYPQSNYALLMNVPADVKPDWREAAEQMKVYAAARGWVF